MNTSIEIAAAKKALRKEVAEKEKAIPQSQIEAGDAAIYEQLVEMPELRAAQTVFCYYSMGREVDTHRVIGWILSHGKRLALPVCGPGGSMTFHRVTDLQKDLEVGRFGIIAPKKEMEILMPVPGDFCIVPCAACDQTGKRMGRGGGYYDRWLSENPAFSVCLCRDAFIYERVPADTFDQTVKVVLSEKGAVGSSA